jgi:4-amino-4-deoxy-L-arabinose transferase-like glycosyltransferase
LAGLPERFLFLFLAALLFTGGAALRLAQLPERVLHGDEGVQAFQTWKLLRTGVYNYSPEDRHGPVLYLFSAAAVSLAGISADELTAHHLRLFSTVSGLVLLALVLGRGAARRDPAWIAGGALLAASPFAVCYQNYYVQEAFFATFSLVALWLLAGTRTHCDRWRVALLGVVLGILFATKGTAVLHLGAGLVAWFAVGGRDGWKGAWRPSAFLWLGLSAALVWILLMSQGLRRWDSLVDGFRSFVLMTGRAGGHGHEKPFFYYLSLFLPQFRGGVWWSQTGLLLGGLAGALAAWRGRRGAGAAGGLAMLAVFTWVLFFGYSLVPYKTPWLMLTPVLGLCLLTGVALDALRRAVPVGWAGWLLAAAAFALVAGEAVRQWRPALFRYADDERNPYLYTHTTPGFQRLVHRLDALWAVRPSASLAVVQPEFAWPLPWHLRGLERVGYFEALPADPAGYDLLVIDARLVPAETPPFLAGYVAEVHGLRTNVLLFLYIREPIWEAFLAEAPTPLR